MNSFFNRLFHPGRSAPASGNLDRQYVSDYTHFIDQFLEQHPEVVADQHDGRLIYWEKIVDLKAQARAEKDAVPDDGYGFYAAAWRGAKH